MGRSDTSARGELSLLCSHLTKLFEKYGNSVYLLNLNTLAQFADELTAGESFRRPRLNLSRSTLLIVK